MTSVVMTTVLFQRLHIQVPAEDLDLLRAGLAWMGDTASAKQVDLLEDNPEESRRVLSLAAVAADAKLSTFKLMPFKGVKHRDRPGVIKAKQHIIRLMSHLKGLACAQSEEDGEMLEDRLNRIEEKLDMILRLLDGGLV